MPRPHHVHLQATYEIRLVLKRAVKRGLLPRRIVCLTDSRVAAGAWSEGRSSAYNINGILRKNIGRFILGHRSITLVWTNTHDNPADDPSKFVALRLPQVPEPWLSPMLVPEPTGAVAERERLGMIFRFLELYSGCGRLSAAASAAGALVLPPVDAYTAQGAYSRDQDFNCPDVVARIRRLIVECVITFVHLGLPCTTWGALGPLSDGTRTSEAPSGTGTKEKEMFANSQLSEAIRMIHLLLYQK